MKPGFKQSEVGQIPADWCTRPCSEISDFVTVGIVVRPTQYYASQGVPALRSANIREDGIDERDMVFISEKANALLFKSQVRTGDVLTVRTGYPGTSAVVPPSLSGSNCIDILITRPSEMISPHYLSAWINSSSGKSQVLQRQGGLAQQHFNVGELRNLLVALPPNKAEQEAIAAALTDTDAFIEHLEQLLAKERDLKQGTMQCLLTGKKRLLGFKGKWAVTSIGQFTDCTAGGTPSTRIPQYWGGSIRWMNSGELNLRFVHEVEGRITADGLRYSSTKMVPADCVLIGLAGQGKTRGTVAINLVPLCINQSIAAVLPSAHHIPKYLYYNLASRYDELRELSSGEGGRGGLNLTTIRNVTLPMPTYEEQDAIAAILSDMDADIAVLENRLQKARLLKQGIAQKLLTGKIRLV